MLPREVIRGVGNNPVTCMVPLYSERYRYSTFIPTYIGFRNIHHQYLINRTQMSLGESEKQPTRTTPLPASAVPDLRHSSPLFVPEGSGSTSRTPATKRPASCSFNAGYDWPILSPPRAKGPPPSSYKGSSGTASVAPSISKVNLISVRDTEIYDQTFWLYELIRILWIVCRNKIHIPAQHNKD